MEIRRPAADRHHPGGRACGTAPAAARRQSTVRRWQERQRHLDAVQERGDERTRDAAETVHRGAEAGSDALLDLRPLRNERGDARPDERVAEPNIARKTVAVHSSCDAINKKNPAAEMSRPAAIQAGSRPGLISRRTTPPCTIAPTRPQTKNMRPNWAGVTSNRSMPNHCSVDSMPASENVTKKASTYKYFSGPVNAVQREGRFFPEPRRSGGSDSRSVYSPVTNSSADSADAARTASQRDAASSPPIPGPNVKPRPIDIPTSPIPRVRRCSGGVMSATYATMTETTAPENNPPTQARRVHERQMAPCQTEQEKARREAEHAGQNDRTAADPVGQRPPCRVTAQTKPGNTATT